MYDVVIIGAGAAGLRAALELKKLGLDFLIIEARASVGGRAKSVGESPAIALGAEFLHGRAEETKALLDHYGQAYSELNPKFQALDPNGKKITGDYWGLLVSAFSHLPSNGKDRPFSDYLKSTQLSPLCKKVATAFVEGFDAAEVDRISTRALAEGVGMFQDVKERALGRPLLGYRALWHAMVEEVSECLRLRMTAESIEWKPGEAVIRARTNKRVQILRARKALITLPIGVLKAGPKEKGAITFMPKIPHFNEALSKIEMGHVERYTFEFSPPAYTELTKKFDQGVPFMATPDLEFSAWWSEQPLHWPVLTAWAGGGRAIALAQLPLEKRKEIALKHLSHLLGRRREALEAALVRIHHHDWTTDPFSRGAYSYPGIDSQKGIKYLRRSVEETLYFAGEALEIEHGGTVEGALRSGRDQALRLATSFRRPGKSSAFSRFKGVSPAESETRLR